MSEIIKNENKNKEMKIKRVQEGKELMENVADCSLSDSSSNN